MCAHQDEFTQLDTRVLFISFGTLPGLEAWMREACGAFDVLLDRDRSVYRAYQLDRSRWRSWHPHTLWTYARLLAAGRVLTPAAQGADTSQLGGDFIVDSRGMLRLAYRSHDPADRPPVEGLLKVLKGLR